MLLNLSIGQPLAMYLTTFRPIKSDISFTFKIVNINYFDKLLFINHIAPLFSVSSLLLNKICVLKFSLV